MEGFQHIYLKTYSCYAFEIQGWEGHSDQAQTHTHLLDCTHLLSVENFNHLNEILMTPPPKLWCVLVAGSCGRRDCTFHIISSLDRKNFSVCLKIEIHDCLQTAGDRKKSGNGFCKNRKFSSMQAVHKWPLARIYEVVGEGRRGTPTRTLYIKYRLSATLMKYYGFNGCQGFQKFRGWNFETSFSPKIFSSRIV